MPIPPPDDDRVQYVSEQDLRRMFNESEYPRMIAEGRIFPQVLRDQHLLQESCQRVNVPYCTSSQVIRYFDERKRWVVEIHQYKMADGSLAASGLPDPKRLRLGGVLYLKARA